MDAVTKEGLWDGKCLWKKGMGIWMNGAGVEMWWRDGESFRGQKWWVSGRKTGWWVRRGERIRSGKRQHPGSAENEENKNGNCLEMGNKRRRGDLLLL